jgi:transcriptional regulator GlxA family with amidase domain
VASVCTGAFLLAACGLLDDRVATTHWRFAAELQRRFPKVRVNADRIYAKDGNVWTSAGITAGIDLALALIEDDFGIDVSKAVARDTVVYHLVFPSQQSDDDSGPALLGPDRELNLWRSSLRPPLTI